MKPHTATPRGRSVAVMAAGLTTFLNLYTAQAILPAIATTFGADLAQTGLTVTAPLFAVAGVAPFAGAISDRLGRKRLIVAACFLELIPTLLVAQSGSLTEMVVWRFLQGLLLPFIFAVTVAYVGDECDGPDAVRTASLYAMGAIMGGFLGRFVAGILSDVAGWRTAFVAIAGITLLGGVVVTTLLPPEQRFRPVHGGLRGMWEAYASHLRNRRLLATCGIGFGMLFSLVATFTYVNFYLAAPPFLLSAAALAFIFTVYMAGLLTTSLAAQLAQRLGRRPALVIAVALATVGCVLTLVPHLAAVIAGLSAIAGGEFVVQALSLSFIGIAVPHARSSAVGLYVTSYYTGGALGGLLPGWPWATVGWPGVVAVLLLVQAVMAWLGIAAWRDQGGPKSGPASAAD